MKKPLIYSSFLFLFLASLSQAFAKEQSVVLISIDGFRWDYIEKHGAKHLKKLSQLGVRGQKLISVYPSKTFPSHISIATGLLPVNHGIVENRFCDKTRNNQCYSMGQGKIDSTWLKGIPIWNLAKMQGLKSASYFWPESDARYNGMTPDYFYHYSKYSDYQGRIDQIIQWLSLPEATRPRFVSGYFSLVDTIGHDYGPNAPQTRDAVNQVDALIGQLHKRLSELEHDVNLIVVADHGMAEVDPEKSIQINSLPVDGNFLVKNADTRLLIYAKPNVNADIEGYKNKLQEAANGRYQVLSNEQLRNYHYEGPRVGDIVVQTNAPAVFTQDKKAGYLGMHGYANTDDMAAMFVAVGPAFNKGVTIDKVNSLDIYPIMAKILGLTIHHPIDSDGSTLLPALSDEINSPQ